MMKASRNSECADRLKCVCRITITLQKVTTAAKMSANRHSTRNRIAGLLTDPMPSSNAFLVSGFWLLVSGFWLLASGFWFLVLASGFWLLASGLWLLVSGFWLLVLVSGFWLLVS